MRTPQGDEALLELLAQALEPRALEPSSEELAGLQRTLAQARRSGVLAPPARRRWLPRLAAVLSGASVVLGGGAAAAWASGAALPAPLRSAAVALGLPVDDGAVASARRDIARLRRALKKADAVQVSVDARALRSRLARMGAHDLSAVEREADRELAMADHRLGESRETHQRGRPSAGAPGSEGGPSGFEEGPSGSEEGNPSSSGGEGAGAGESSGTPNPPSPTTGDGSGAPTGDDDRGSSASSTRAPARASPNRRPPRPKVDRTARAIGLAGRGSPRRPRRRRRPGRRQAGAAPPTTSRPPRRPSWSPGPRVPSETGCEHEVCRQGRSSPTRL